MEAKKFDQWNQLVFYVHHVYRETKRFKPGVQSDLGGKIRTTAIRLAGDINGLNENEIVDSRDKKSKIYPIISAISVLETYLLMARRSKFLKDTALLNGELRRLKEGLMRMLGE